MKRLVLALLFFNISSYTCEDQPVESIEIYLQSFKNVYYNITDHVLDNLLEYFDSLEYDADLYIPTIRKRCIAEVDNFIYLEKGVDKDIVDFLKMLNTKAFTSNELSRIVEMIRQVSALQAKVICLSVN